MTNTVFRVFLYVLFFSYISHAIGDETIVREQYTVRINGMPMVRDSAENILHYVNNNVIARNNADGKNVLLSKIEKNMDIYIENVFLNQLVKLYNEFLNESVHALFENANRKCVIVHKFEKDTKVSLCINKGDGVITELSVI